MYLKLVNVLTLELFRSLNVQKKIVLRIRIFKSQNVKQNLKVYIQQFKFVIFKKS